jgi:hypothetical protein
LNARTVATRNKASDANMVRKMIFMRIPLSLGNAGWREVIDADRWPGNAGNL